MAFVRDRVVLLKYRPDLAAAVPEYDRYALERVMVREIFAADPDAVEKSGAVVYFLDRVSVCRGMGGEVTSLPQLSKGDMVLLHEGTDAEAVMRVSEAGYFNGETLAHVRIRLK